MFTNLISNAPAGLFEGDAEEFYRQLNRRSFAFRHDLCQHPLFELPRLLELARDTARSHPKDLYYDAGTIRVNQRLDQTPRPAFSVEEALQRIEQCGAWVVLHKAERDPEYAVLLKQCMDELQDLIGLNLNRVMNVQEAVLFITSPKRLTAYHIDRDCNFLLQIRGNKTISVFDPSDREVLTEEELERYWAGDFRATVYKPQYQNRARIYRLTPGTAVHIPVNAPHWLENDDNVSISLSVSFFLFRERLRGNIYRFNYALRKLGLQPTPPGRSALADSLRSYAVEPALWVRNILRGKAPWT